MACEHKRLKSVNGVVSCIECGEILPADVLTKKNPTKAQTAAESPENAPKKASRRKVK